MLKLNKITNFLDTHPIGRIFNLGQNKAVWKRVTELKVGMKIAVAKEKSMATWLHGYMANEKRAQPFNHSTIQPSDPDVLWDEIVSIKKVGRERVYDIEVEGTHNFVGNGIIAHNTNLSLTDTGDLNIKEVQSAKFEVQNEKTGDIIERVAAFANVVAANIRAGAVIASQITTDGFIAFQGTIDHLLITSGLVAGNIQTKLISPLADSDTVTIQTKNLVIENASGSAEVKVKGTVNSEQLMVNGEATIAGTLYADDIKSKSLDEIQALLAQVTADQDLLAQASNWNINTASDSAKLDQLAVLDLYVTNQGAFNSLSVANTMTIGSDLVIQSSLDPIYNILYTSLDTLSAPLKIQSLAMAPLEIMAGLVTIDTHGNVQIAGNLFVAGRIESSGLTLKDNQNYRDVQGDNLYMSDASASASLLSLQNNQGVIVASVDASGSAIFTNIQTQRITGSDEDRGSVEILPAEDSKVVQRDWNSTPSAVLVSSSYKTQAWVTDISGEGFTIRVSDSPADSAGKLFWWALW